MQDPIEQIRKAEEAGKAELDNLGQKLHKEVEAKKDELDKKLLSFEHDLREKGNKKLNTVRQEAGELYKSKIATIESDKTKLKLEADGKTESAIQMIEQAFTDHIKN